MNWMIFASGVGVLMGAGALLVALAALRSERRWRGRVDSLQSSFDASRREVERLASIISRTGRRVQQVEHEFCDVAERVDVVESLRPSIASAGSLDQAIDWARHGAAADTLATQFGISRGEAELVSRLHGAPVRMHTIRDGHRR